MNTTGWPHTLLLFGVVMSALLAVVYFWGMVTVRKQGRKLGFLPTSLTVLGIVAILFIATHGDLFQLLLLHAKSGLWFISSETTHVSVPISHVIATTPAHRHTGSLAAQQVSLQVQKVSARPQHVSLFTSSSAPHPAPWLMTLEGIASIVGSVLALCIVLVGLSLVVRHMRQRQEDAFLDAPSSGCAMCGQEGEFPSYRDRKGHLAHLCSDCVSRFQVTPVG